MLQSIPKRWWLLAITMIVLAAGVADLKGCEGSGGGRGGWYLPPGG